MDDAQVQGGRDASRPDVIVCLAALPRGAPGCVSDNGKSAEAPSPVSPLRTPVRVDAPTVDGRYGQGIAGVRGARARRHRTVVVVVAAGSMLATVLSSAAATAQAAGSAASPSNAERRRASPISRPTVTNGTPKHPPVSSGPGHNAWMMTSTAAGALHGASLGSHALFYGVASFDERTSCRSWRSASAARGSSPSRGGWLATRSRSTRVRRSSYGGLRFASPRGLGACSPSPTPTTGRGSRATSSRCISCLQCRHHARAHRRSLSQSA